MIKYLSNKLVKAVAVVALAGFSGVADAQAPPFHWSQAGPVYNAGRARNMVIDNSDPSGNTMYVGSASSGVFYSTNGGTKWNAINLVNNKLNVSYLAQGIDHKLYVATGEGFLRPGQKSKAQAGTGLYRVDFGPLPSSQATLTALASSTIVGTVINRIACSPVNANLIVAATNLGIMISIDGGLNFTPSSIPTPSLTFGQDLKFDGNGILYCSVGNENSITTTEAGVYSRVWKSIDNTLVSGFTQLTNLTSSLLQDDHYGRIELAIAPTNNNVIYASCATKYSGNSAPASSTLKGLFVSYDGGANWGLILQGSAQLDPLGNGGSVSSGDYSQVITVDPFNSDRLYMGGYQFYYWTRTGGNNSNPVGTWIKQGNTFAVNSQLYLAPNIHDIKLITSGSSISKFYFITDAGVYRSLDLLTSLIGLASFQPFYKGLVTGQFNSVSIERFPISNVPTSPSSSVTPFVGFIGGTGGNGLNYYSGLNDTLVTKEVVYTGGDIYQAEFSKILPNAAYFTQGSGKLFRSTDVRTSDPTQLDLLVNSKLQTIIPFANAAYNVTGTPFKLWENYGQTTAPPDSAVFYNDTLRFSASMIGVSQLTTQVTFTFSAARPSDNALIDSIVVRTGTVVLPIANSASAAPGFSGTDKKDITIKLPNNYVANPTGSTNVTPCPTCQVGPVISASTSVVLNATTLLDNISITFTAPPFMAKTTASSTNVPDYAAYYRVFCTVFYKYKAGDIVTVVDDKISTKTYTYSTALTAPLNWAYGSSLSKTITASPASSVALTPTFVLASGSSTVSSTTSSSFVVSPVTATAYTLSAYGTYTVSAKPVTYTINAVPAGTATIPSPTYNLMPGNVTQASTVFIVTPTATTNYTITEGSTSTTVTAQTFSTVGASTYVLNPGNVNQSSPIFTVTTPTTGLTTYTLQGLSSNTVIGANTSTTAVLPIQTFSTVGYFLASVSPSNIPVKIPTVTSARLAMGYGPNVYVSNAPLSLNNPLSMINISSNKCLTTDAAGNKLSGASNTVAISGTLTTLEWSKSGTELYYATNDPFSGSTFLYRVSYIDALLDSTSKSYSGKLHTNVFTYTNTLAPDGTRNNPRSPYRTALLGTYTKIITSISVSNDNKSIAYTFDDPTGTKVMYSTVADVRKCNGTTYTAAARDGSGLPSSKIYCSLMEMSDNKKVFLGTDVGLYYTADITAASPSWIDASGPVPTQLPSLQIFDIKQQVMKPWDCYNSGLIYAATNGRGVWVNKDYQSAYYVSVQELAAAEKAENNLSLFPNPTNGSVNVIFNSIDGETATITVMDINGRVVKQESLGKLNSGKASYSFETADLSSGMYIVNISSDSRTKRVAKLIVTK